MTAFNGNRFIIKFSQFDDEITNLGDSTAKIYYSITTDNIRIKWIDLKHEFDKAELTMEIFNKYFNLYFDTFKRSVMSFFECCYVDEEQTIIGLCLKSKFKKPDHPDYPSAMLVCSSINSHVSLRPKIAVYPNGGFTDRIDCTSLNQTQPGDQSFVAVDDDNINNTQQQPPPPPLNETSMQSSTSPPPRESSSATPSVIAAAANCVRNSSVRPNNNNDSSLLVDYYEDIVDHLDDDDDDEIFLADICTEANSPVPCTSKPASVDPQPVLRAISSISTGCKRKASDDENDDEVSTPLDDFVGDSNELAVLCNQTVPATFAPNAKRPRFFSVAHDVVSDKLLKKLDDAASSSSSSSSESEFGADGNDLDEYEEDHIFELQSEISCNDHENESIACTTYDRFGQFDLGSQIMSSTRRAPQPPLSDIGSSVVNNFNKFTVQPIDSRASSAASVIRKKMHRSKHEKTGEVILAAIAGKIVSNVDLNELDEIQFRDLYQYYTKDALNEKDKSMQQNVTAQKLKHVFDLYTEDSSSVFNTRMLILAIRQILIDRDANMRNFLLVGQDDATIK